MKASNKKADIMKVCPNGSPIALVKLGDVKVLVRCKHDW